MAKNYRSDKKNLFIFHKIFEFELQTVLFSKQRRAMLSVSIHCLKVEVNFVVPKLSNFSWRH